MNTDQSAPAISPAATAIDVSAATVSALCLIHCLAIPVVVALTPLGAVWLENEYLHRILVLTAVPVSGYAIVASLVQGEGILFPLAAMIGLGLLTIAAFAEAMHDYETIGTVAGAITLGVAHIGRWSGRRHRCAQQ